MITDGLMVGTVKENYNKDYPGMVQVSYPSMGSEGNTAAWMPVASLYAGKDYGMYFLPEKDEQVVVGFIGGDPHCGVVLGSLWNVKNTIPKDTVTEKNEVRTIVTKGGHSIQIKDGDEGSITVKSKAGHKIEIAEKDKKMTLSTSDGKNTITLDEDKSTVSIESGDKLTLKAKEISLDGKLAVKGQSVSIQSDGELSAKGKQVKVEGNTLKINGQSAELSGANLKVESQGILTLKGSMTKIN